MPLTVNVIAGAAFVFLVDLSVLSTICGDACVCVRECI